jgi:hypothetical protein
VKFLIKKVKEMNRQINPKEGLGTHPTQFTWRKDTLPTLPQGVFHIFLGHGIMDPKIHMDEFLSVCDIHLIEHDDVMVIFFLQILIGPAYEWYISLLAQSIGSFYDL